MEAADEAVLARIAGDKRREHELLTVACDFEAQAARLAVQLNAQEPTRSVLLRSAVALAVDCNRVEEARDLLALASSVRPPEPIRGQLLELEGQLDAVATSESDEPSMGQTVRRLLQEIEWSSMLERVKKKPAIRSAAQASPFCDATDLVHDAVIILLAKAERGEIRGELNAGTVEAFITITAHYMARSFLDKPRKRLETLLEMRRSEHS